MAAVETILASRRPVERWYVKNLCTVWWRWWPPQPASFGNPASFFLKARSFASSHHREFAFVGSSGRAAKEKIDGAIR